MPKIVPSSLLRTEAVDLQHKDGFWQRQSSGSTTPFQLIFDVVFGVVMPIVCFYFDPGIIRGNFFAPVLSSGIFLYTLSIFAILTLLLWWAIGHRAKLLSGVFGGILLTGAICSLGIGVVILPLSLIGLLIIIGILGFVPFITAFVYWRNAMRAIKQGEFYRNGLALVAVICISAVAAYVVPAMAQWEVGRMATQSVSDILGPDPAAAEGAVQRIKQFRLVVETDKVVQAYQEEAAQERKDRLAKAYKEITGEDIEDRLAILND